MMTDNEIKIRVKKLLDLLKENKDKIKVNG
jgi:hypothetical protein